MQFKRILFSILSFCLLGLGAVIVFVPLIWVLFESLKTNREYFQSTWSFPAVLQFNNYVRAWSELNIFTYMKNTLIILVITLSVSTLIISMCGYVLARFKFKLNSFIFWLIISSMMLPGLNAIVVQYVMLKNVHLINNLIGVCIYFIAALIPFSIFLITGFMKTIPKEMEEAAYVDGASYTKTFFVIILPMCKSGIIAMNIFNFLGVYNSYLGPLILLSDDSKYPISVGVTYMYILTQYKADWVALFAGIMISIIPIIVFYSFFQKQLVAGTTTGAIKG